MDDKKRKRIVFFAAVVVLAAAAAVGWVSVKRPDDAGLVMPAEVDIARGEALYGEYCAGCHGAELEGQPEWQSRGPDGRLPAPPHDETGHTWHHADDVLFQYTKLGGRAALALRGVDFDSGMPGFGDKLSDQQIWDILGFIKSRWPERERAAQAERTAAGLAD